MKNFICALGVGLMLMLSSNLLAIQGSLTSSSGFVGSSIGGATVAQFTNEFDAVIDNPALMDYTKTKPGTHKFSLGFAWANYPNWIEGSPATSYTKGKRDSAYLPFIGYFYNINEKFKFGTGLYAIGGTGYDYPEPYNQKGLYAAVSVPLAASYKVSDAFALGASLNLVLTQISSNNSGLKDTNGSSATATPAVGATYAITRSLLLGADVGLGTTAEFKNFYYPVDANNGYDLKIGTPLQASIGIGQNTENYSYGFKYRFINWKNTESYKQLGWADQHTFSLGGQYKFSDFWTGRAGIYHVTKVFETSGVNGAETITYGGQPLTKFFRDYANAIMNGMPQWQYALGGGYKIMDKSMLDFGLMYEPETLIKFTGSFASVPYYIKKKNSNIQMFLAYSHEV